MDDGSENGRHDNNIGYANNGSGNDASIQKRNAASAALDFSDVEWDSLKALREANGVEMSKGATVDDNGNYTGELEQGTRRSGAQLTRERCKS